MKIFRVIIILAFGFTMAKTETTSLRKLGGEEQAARITDDQQAVLIYRDGLLAVTAFIRQQTNLFPKTKGDFLPRREDKKIVWQAWVNYLDYLLALDSMDHFYSDWFQLSGKRQDQAFDLKHAAFLDGYERGNKAVESNVN